MPRRFDLSWDKHTKRWKKFYRGRRYYLGHAPSKDDLPAYRRALVTWQRKKAEIDGVDEPDGWQQLIGRALVRLDDLEQIGTPSVWNEWRLVRALVGNYRGLQSQGADCPPELLIGDDKRPPIVAVAEFPPAPWDTVHTPTAAELADTDRTIGGYVKRFLSNARSSAERGDISFDRYDGLRTFVEAFRDQIGADKPVSAIDGEAMANYREWLMTKVDEAVGKRGKDGFGRKSAKHYLSAATQFVKWLGDRVETFVVPKVLTSRQLIIKVAKKPIIVFSRDEVATLLAKANDRTKLFLLLTLNCAMTQIDLASLQQDEVDWDSGYITRQRSKTRKLHGESVPTVRYKLWDETFRLLKQFRSTDPLRVLLNRDGKPLRIQSLRDNGKLSKSDAIKCAFYRLARSAGIDKSFKTFRATASTILGEHETFKSYGQFFLSQAPSTVADTFYIVPSQQLFDSAVNWLGEQLGFKT